MKKTPDCKEAEVLHQTRTGKHCALKLHQLFPSGLPNINSVPKQKKM